MTIIGRTRHAIPLGIKLEECSGCGTIGPHAVARRVRWFEVLSMQLVRLGSDHVLVCGRCGLESPVSSDIAKAGVESGTMQLQRERPLVEAEVARAVGPDAADPHLDPAWPVLRQDPAELRATYDRRLSEVHTITSPDRQRAYTRSWPVLALVVAVAVLIPGGSAAIQAAHIVVGAPSVGATSRPDALASPSPTANAIPTQRPFATLFAAWAQTYKSDVLPCYSGGPCHLEQAITHNDGTSRKLKDEATRLALVYRDSDTLQTGSAIDCRQEHASMFTLLASVASEISVLQAVQPGEAIPKGWAPSADVTFEPCTTALPDPKSATAAVRTGLAQARAQLVLAKKLIKAKDWSGLGAASERLTVLAAQIARASARDFPASGPSWAPVRAVAWDLMRTGGLLEIRRLAAAASTAKLIDGEISAIDHVKLAGS